MEFGSENWGKAAGAASCEESRTLLAILGGGKVPAWLDWSVAAVAGGNWTGVRGWRFTGRKARALLLPSQPGVRRGLKILGMEQMTVALT